MTSPEAKSAENIMRLDKVSHEDFVKHLTKKKEDRFAKTFVAKCNMMKAWDKCVGIWEGEELCAAIVVTISKRKPHVANLQLLHTFHAHRGKGAAKTLCEWGVSFAKNNAAEYFRVSAELDAVAFYEKVGFKFVCRQKTAKLAMFKLTSEMLSQNDMGFLDELIWKTMNKKGKGGCVECYVEYKGVTCYSGI